MHSTIRSQYLPSIATHISATNPDVDAATLIQAILDPSKLISNPARIATSYNIARSLIYHLHRKRSALANITRPRNLCSTVAKKAPNILTYRGLPTTVSGCVSEERRQFKNK